MGRKLEYEMRSDAELLRLIKIDDESAYVEIYDKYWPLLFLHANRLLQDEAAAQDIVQEVFIWLLEHQKDLGMIPSLKSYLYSAVKNGILNHIRHKKVRANYAEDITIFMKESFHFADEELIAKDLENIIDAEIEKMPPKMREIFNLSRKRHLSRKEIAALLDLSEGTVRTQIQRALKVLHGNQHLGISMTLLAILDIASSLNNFIHLK